jgi:hypothetical protein
MWCFFCILFQSIVLIGIREDERAGLWSWSRFLFALAFTVLEAMIVVLPAYLIQDTHNRYSGLSMLHPGSSPR